VRHLSNRRFILTAAIASAAAQALKPIDRSTAKSTSATSPAALALASLSENERKAVAVLQSLATGDPTAIEKYVSADTYTQHNLRFPDGRQTLLDALPMVGRRSTCSV
jgi:hypothetical protein